MSFNQEVFNNIEMANIFWLLIFLLVALSFKTVRSAMLGVLKAFLEPKLLSVFIAALLFAIAIVLLLHRIHFWKWSLLKDTIFWFIGTAFVLIINANATNHDERWFKKVLKDSLALVFILEFIIGLYSFGLITMLLLVPVIVFLSMIGKVAKAKEEHAQVRKLVESLLGIIGIGMIAFAVFKIVDNISAFVNFNNLRAFLLPPILTIAFLPFIYMLALGMGYEQIFLSINLRLKENRALSRFAKRKIFTLCLFNLRKLNRFSKQSVGKLWQTSEKKDVTDLIQAFKSTRTK